MTVLEIISFFHLSSECYHLRTPPEPWKSSCAGAAALSYSIQMDGKRLGLLS